MSMYAIQDTTLTALGDAVRNKTSKYIAVEEKGEPFFTATIDTTLVEPSYTYSGVYHYEVPIDFPTLLGDMYDYMKRLYVEYEYEVSLNQFWCNITFRSDEQYKGTQGTIVSIFDQSSPLSGTGSKYGSISTLPYNQLQLNVYPTWIESGKTAKVSVKIWACDANDKFLVLNKYTPLEMVDEINRVNTEAGKKLPWIVQRTDVPNFTITAEDIAGVSKIGINAFSNNKTLTAIELPDTVQEFSDQSLYATGITEITLPVALSRIRNSVFSYCNNLTTVRILNDTSVITCPTASYANPFNSCPKLTSIYIPSKLYNDYCADAYWSQHKDKFIAVGEWAFDPQINPTLLFNQSIEVSIQLQSFANTPEFSITSSNEEVATISNISINENNTLLTYTINSLAVEGSSTITVNIVGENNTFNFTNNVNVFETIPEPTYEVVAVDGATYGFALREDGYWESQNFKKSGSASVCQVNISNMKGVPVYFDCINYAEANFDYGLLGAVNQVLGKTNSDDSGVKKNFKGLSKIDIQTVEYTDATGDCFIQVKFRKDGSGDQDNDSIRFKVRFGE